MKPLLTLLLMVPLLVMFHAHAQQAANSSKTYEIDMYLGVPAEILPEEARKQLKPEEPVLVAFSTLDGKFHANSGDVAFEGTISNDENNKIRVQISDSRYGSTGCPNINVAVAANEPIEPRVCAFSSIIFSYYFRVRVSNTVKVPCDGGVLDDLVLAEVKPAYPAEAKQAKAGENVVLRVRIDEQGNVYEVLPCVGNLLLSQSATDAAYQTKFKPTLVSGKAVRVTGVLVYEFKFGEDKGKLYRRDVEIDRRDPEAVLRAYFAAWNRNDLGAEKSFMTTNYAGLVGEPVDSLIVLSIKVLDENDSRL